MGAQDTKIKYYTFSESCIVYAAYLLLFSAPKSVAVDGWCLAMFVIGGYIV